jgi:hypothetical protein
MCGDGGLAEGDSAVVGRDYLVEIDGESCFFKQFYQAIYYIPVAKDTAA